MSMATEHTVLFSADVIAEKVGELAGRIDRDYGDDGVAVVVLVLKGAAIFAADLVRRRGGRVPRQVSRGG
jgi:hypoxanthine-guanine phosphoribosyltransferase